MNLGHAAALKREEKLGAEVKAQAGELQRLRSDTSIDGPTDKELAAAAQQLERTQSELAECEAARAAAERADQRFAAFELTEDMAAVHSPRRLDFPSAMPPGEGLPQSPTNLPLCLRWQAAARRKKLYELQHAKGGLIDQQ